MLFAALLAVSGGVRATVGGLRISARSPLGASVAAIAAAAAWLVLARRANAVTTDLDDAWAALENHGRSLVVLVAAVGGIVAAVFATGSASGADASGYLSEAAHWASGQIFHRDALAAVVGGDPWLTSPLGWRPSPLAGLQSPTYPPGLPLLMAVPHALGGTAAAAFVVSVSAALAIWATGWLAMSLAGGVAGIVAAIALAAGPVFLFQSIQPMSDVPVTAAWMVMWVLLVTPRWPRTSTTKDAEDTENISHVGAAGVACAIAVLIRPNLAPLAAVPLLLIGWHLRRAIVFSIPVALAGLMLMWLQWQWYGSPLRSGYGTAGELFALANIGANASRYLRWVFDTSPALLLAPIGLVLAWRHPATKALVVFAALVASAYLVYAVFDEWSYLRFLLPSLAVAAAFLGVAAATVLRRVPVPARVASVLAVVLVLTAHGVSQARALGTFRLADQQRRVSQVSAYLASTLPAEAVIISGEQSGALRYYTGRSILRWDAASSDSLAAALSTLNAAGRPVVIALDAWENDPFRAKFNAVASVSLEWPPAFEAGTSHRTRVWRLRDREAFQKGAPVRTQRGP